MAQIEVRHLEELAGTTIGKTAMGELLRRMVYATVAKSRPHLHFLAGATNGYPGWDGWVEVSYEEAGTWRTHRSVWEISTDKNFEAKFKRDFKDSKGKGLPNNWDRQDIVYVGVTLRSATPTRLRSIARSFDKSERSRWSGVVLLAADDIAQWLEKVPSAEDWATTELRIGNGRYGKSLEHWFASWSAQTDPRTAERLVSAGRDLAPIQNALKPDAEAVCTLQSDSVEEAIALVYCAVKTLDADEAALVFSGALVVTDDVLADRLSRETVPADAMPMVVVAPPATKHRKALVDAGYRVIQALGRSDEGANVLRFERASVSQFSAVLAEAMGIEQAEAEIQARSAGSSVSVWHIRNLFEQSAQPELPSWCTSADVDAIVAAIFAGAWNEDSTPDMAVMESLSGVPIAQLASSLVQYASCSMPLLELFGSTRMLVAPTSAFEFIRKQITRHHIERLVKVVAEVFSVITPAVQTRWKGEPLGIESRDPRKVLSNGLLDGLAESLLRIAVLGDPLAASGALAPFLDCQAFVDHQIRRLPGLGTDPRLLASLDRRLPYLLEAAPIPFLEALESLVQGDTEGVSTLMADESGIFGRSFHTGLLWGLEGLAWSPEYLSRVAHVLASLAEIDRGGQLGNRPSRSLCEIFLAWHPGTSATPQQRVETLRSLVDKHPNAAWQLLLNLLPGKKQTSHMTHRPKWRNLGQVNRRTMLRSEVNAAYAGYVQLTLDVAGNNASKLADIVSDYPNLPPHHRDQIEAALETAISSSANEEDLQRLWNKLNDLCNHHTSFADTEWALPAEKVSRLRTIADAIEFANPVVKHRWLFNDQFPTLPSPERSYEQVADELSRSRQEALREVLDIRGWGGVQELIRTSTYPYLVGNEVGRLDVSADALLEAIDAWHQDGSSAFEMAARSASVTRYGIAGEGWTACALQFAAEHRWKARWLALIVVDYPDEARTYEVVSELEPAAQQEYWKSRFSYIRVADSDVDVFSHAVDGFIAHGRAVELVDQNWSELPKLGYDKVLRVIDSFIEEVNAGMAPKGLGSIQHDVQHLFRWMRDQTQAKPSELAKRELALLPLLTSHGLEREELSVHVLLRESPEFFVEAVCALYKRDDGVDEDEGLSPEQRRNRAHSAFELLESWKSPPGLRNGAVDQAMLTEWVRQARESLRERHRSAIGDEQIGKVLYHVPNETSDGAWPAIAVRNLIEDLRSEHIEIGIGVECVNARGVTSRAMFEGGVQERQLAADWRRRADSLKLRWPRTAALCQDIAEKWKQHAEFEDLQAAKGRAKETR